MTIFQNYFTTPKISLQTLTAKISFFYKENKKKVCHSAFDFNDGEELNTETYIPCRNWINSKKFLLTRFQREIWVQKYYDFRVQTLVAFDLRDKRLTSLFQFKMSFSSGLTFEFRTFRFIYLLIYLTRITLINDQWS